MLFPRQLRKRRKNEPWPSAPGRSWATGSGDDREEDGELSALYRQLDAAIDVADFEAAARIKAQIDDEYRTLSGPRTTGVMGSSLGGVVSFYLAWQYPQVQYKATQRLVRQ